MDQITRWLDQSEINLVPVAGTIVLLVAAGIVILVLNRFLRHVLRNVQLRFHLSYETVLTIARIVHGVLWLIVAMLVLNIWGVGVGGLWTILVSAAAVIGVGFLAVWTMVSNVTASLFITFWRPFHVGETVEVLFENLKGRVIDRNMMFTVLREEGGSILQIPNNLFFQKVFRVAGGEGHYLFEYLGGDARPSAAVSEAGAEDFDARRRRRSG